MFKNQLFQFINMLGFVMLSGDVNYRIQDDTGVFFGRNNSR